MPLTKLDFPDPETPVITVITLSGKLTSIPFKLFILQPFNVMEVFHARRDDGMAI